MDFSDEIALHLPRIPRIPASAFVAPGAIVIGNATLGEESSIWFQAVVRADINTIVIGARSNIQDGTIVHLASAYGTEIGDHVTVGHRAVIHACAIRDEVLVGMGAIVLDGAEIGPQSLIGAGALVTGGTVIPEGSLVLGSPARVVRALSAAERGDLKGWADRYVTLARAYLNGDCQSLREWFKPPPFFFMANVYHPSIEGAQHGAKSLADFLAYAKRSGAAGAQPSNFMLEGKSAAEVRDAFANTGLTLDGVSAHCPIWVHTTAWTNSPTIKPFIPAEVATKTSGEIEQWAETYLLKLLDLLAELGIKVLPMFWGTVYGWEVASGYPWGFWAGPGYDLLKEGDERFVKKTQKIRDHARQLGIKLCHEIHPGTAAATADDFLHLVKITDDDETMGVNADPSHCWEGESWETRFLKVGQYVWAAHIKNFVIRPGFPLRAMISDWPRRAMQFTDLATGDLNLQRYAELLLQVGYPQRYTRLMGRTTAPLVVEAESAHKELDFTSANGVAYVRDHLQWPAAGGSFEDGMGA